MRNNKESDHASLITYGGLLGPYKKTLLKIQQTATTPSKHCLVQMSDYYNIWVLIMTYFGNLAIQNTSSYKRFSNCQIFWLGGLIFSFLACFYLSWGSQNFRADTRVFWDTQGVSHTSIPMGDNKGFMSFKSLSSFIIASGLVSLMWRIWDI